MSLEDIKELQTAHMSLDARVRILEGDMEEIRTELRGLRENSQANFNNIQTSLQNVVTNALNSMPQWAAQSMKTQSTIIGLLGGMCAALFTGCIVLWLHVR
ncbi:MAG: hypothetical protein KGI54_14290 [Pseudomonadota bacterium]|nr:hypothetical protein [Pseudomonadota bacterium]